MNIATVSDDVLELLLGESSGTSGGGTSSSSLGDFNKGGGEKTRSSSEMSVFTSEMLDAMEEPNNVNGSFQMDFTPSWSYSTTINDNEEEEEETITFPNRQCDLNSSPKFSPASSDVDSSRDDDDDEEEDNVHSRLPMPSDVSAVDAAKNNGQAATTTKKSSRSERRQQTNSSTKKKTTTMVSSEGDTTNEEDKAMLSILEKSFSSLMNSPLLPIPGDDVNKKMIVIKGVQLCFASLAVAFDVCTRSIVWSPCLTAGDDNRPHAKTNNNNSRDDDRRPTAVPCEILFLFWEVLAGVDSIELTSEELNVS
jgi:hypothetical protein